MTRELEQRHASTGERTAPERGNLTPGNATVSSSLAAPATPIASALATPSDPLTAARAEIADAVARSAGRSAAVARVLALADRSAPKIALEILELLRPLSDRDPALGHEIHVRQVAIAARLQHEMEELALHELARSAYATIPASGGNAMQGGNTVHTGPVEEGMLVEGWRVYATTAKKGGTIAWKDNNPGNITVEATHVNDGNLFGDYKWTDGLYRVFPTYAAGRAAIPKYFRGWQHRRAGMTIEDMVQQYGDSGAAAHKIYRDLWTKAAGVTAATKLEDLSDAQLEAIADTIVNQEGTVKGTELPRTDPSLPDGVFTGTR